ncbi:cysteine hydrolase [Shewanella eurypsychrophilus]|uniref:Cysteine hydrolase n=1 Tax=Shewanella eurypsychrophilus TaxID=2593656 RepID=A0ABX6V708_9GAMM|nr:MULTISPECIES: isochorismatase family protein [Shewanella]QFU23062.1 isochorismatase family protein [Shewanella sp. YLB-09]QPG58345.1 cysteine hydrolase [Shewanella eurypsychrophilus]
MTNLTRNRVEKWLEENTEHGLPVTGFEIEKGRTAVVITDPQVDFLSPEGVAWGAVGESVLENNTVANLEALMNTAVEEEFPLIISPHYYFPTDHNWKFEGTLEKLMHAINMFDRKSALDVEGFEGSGADWLEELKPAINHKDTVICGAHKVYGPENNDLILQLQKLRVDKVILAGMSANLCVESHLRELVEYGFEVSVVADASAAAKVPGLDGMLAALTNYRMIASDIFSTKQIVEQMKNA